MSKQEGAKRYPSVLAWLGVLLFSAISILLSYGPNAARGTPKLYDYATEPIVQHSMVTNPPGYPSGMYFISESYKIDGRPLVYEPKDVHYVLPFSTFSNTVCTAAGNLAFVNPIPGKKNPVICLTGRNARFSSELGEYRKESRLTLLNDDKLLITGGYKLDGTPSDTIDIFDTLKMKFEPSLGKLNIARAEHSVAKLNNGNILVAGGITTKDLSDSGFNYTSTIELIDLTKKTITLVGQMHQARANAAMNVIGIDKCVIRNGQFLDKDTAQADKSNPNNIEAWEMYEGKTSASKKGPYPPQSYIWCLMELRKKYLK
ncbi:MAG: hypothetical protein KIT34_01110 [Cyanobacteria bacterium TGS_CYA1]|nr:hypothetical protein [Cyanobacteria bacterium TGS_CYA1]